MPANRRGDRLPGRWPRRLARAFTMVATPIACALAAAPLAADGNLSPGRSTLVATFRQQAVAVDASFRRFEGSIDYDPARPAATRASLSVDMNSLDVGDDDTNAEVRKAAWFDSAQFPRASFRSTGIVPRAAGRFDATGELAIKGRTRVVTVAVSVEKLGRDYAYDGSFELSRREFGIGDPAWDEVLDDKVRVHFHLLAAGR